MSFDVFLSYSSKDKWALEAVRTALESAHIRCWVAPGNIRAGAEWAAGIMEGIDSCRVLVLIFSAHANASKQVRREIERAASKGLTIIPFRIEEVTPDQAVEYFLGQIHWLDAITRPLERHLDKLVAQVNANLQLDPTYAAPVQHAKQELHVQIGGIVVCLVVMLILLWSGLDSGYKVTMFFILLGASAALMLKTIPHLKRD